MHVPHASRPQHSSNTDLFRLLFNGNRNDVVLCMTEHWLTSLANFLLPSPSPKCYWLCTSSAATLHSYYSPLILNIEAVSVDCSYFMLYMLFTLIIVLLHVHVHNIVGTTNICKEASTHVSLLADQLVYVYDESIPILDLGWHMVL